jgi:hypothetical protein
LPNAIVSFDDNATFFLRANREITAGEEIEISYLADMKLSDLKDGLLDQYCFVCDCDLCKENPDPREYVEVCEEESVDGETTIESVNLLVESAFSDIESNPLKFEAPLQTLNTLCGSQNMRRFQALTIIQDRLLYQHGDFDFRVEDIARERLAYMREFLSPNHPGTGIQAFMLVKMLALRAEPNVDEIMKLFEYAKKVLIVALGERSRLVSVDLAEFQAQVMNV